MIIDVFAQSILFLTQEVTTNFKIVSVSHFLQLSDSVKTNISVQSVHDHLNLIQSVRLEKSISLSVAHTLVFTQETQPKVHVVEASNHLALSHEAKNETQFPLVRHYLNLTQSVTVDVSKAASNVLQLTHEATYTISRLVQAANTLSLDSTATAYKPSKYWTSYDVVVEEP